LYEDAKKESSLPKPKIQNINAKLHKEVFVTESLDIIFSLRSRELIMFRSIDLPSPSGGNGEGKSPF
jgi:hypothetical protein